MPSTTHHTTHETTVAAAPEVVYALIADAQAWPVHFAPTIHVERTEVDATTERLRIWATANGEVKSWTSLRVLDPVARRVTFRQEVSTAPVAAMGGEWIVEQVEGGSKLTLLHDFVGVDETRETFDWISTAVDTNSGKELANIKNLAENAGRRDELVFDFEDSVVIEGSLDAAYDFLYQAKQWPDRLPHVAAMDLREDVENLQWMRMDTRAKDGSVHTTESIRVCVPGETIIYKQLVPPALMTVHVGQWKFEQVDGGVKVTSEHTVALNEPNIPTILGPDATTATAREFIRKAAGGNSAATLALAKKFIEGTDA